MDNRQPFDKYEDIITNCELFVDIPSKCIIEMLQSLRARIKTFKKNEIIIHLGETFSVCGLVLDGIVEVSYNTRQFEKINLNHFRSGQLFGESLSLMKFPHSPIQVTSLMNSTVLLLDLNLLMLSSNRCTKSCVYNHQLLLNLLSRITTQNIFLNLKLRILSQKSLRDRIMIYLTNIGANTGDGASIPFTKTALAEFLGVNRSSLSRELGRMQDEGLLVIDGNKYKILPQ